MEATEIEQRYICVRKDESVEKAGGCEKGEPGNANRSTGQVWGIHQKKGTQDNWKKRSS